MKKIPEFRMARILGVMRQIAGEGERQLLGMALHAPGAHHPDDCPKKIGRQGWPNMDKLPLELRGKLAGLFWDAGYTEAALKLSPGMLASYGVQQGPQPVGAPIPGPGGPGYAAAHPEQRPGDVAAAVERIAAMREKLRQQQGDPLPDPRAAAEVVEGMTAALRQQQQRPIPGAYMPATPPEAEPKL